MRVKTGERGLEEGNDVGDFLEEVPDGSGTKVFKNGDVYVGDFKEGKMSGFGILKYGDSEPDLKNVIKEGDGKTD